MKKVVIIGGGTGTFVVTRILKDYDLQLTKIVSVFDSGGSTGRLKDEFGFLPVGDLRQSLAALAAENGQAWVQQLLLYRFEKGNGLKGHNLGNLILIALQDMTGSTPKALEIAAKIFRLTGKIYPVTTDQSELIAEYEDGQIVSSEHELDDMENGGKRITNISLSSDCQLYEKAEQALLEADYIIFGPGDVYASILPNLIVRGMPETLKRSAGKCIYIVNLMTRYTQTHGYTATDHLAAIEKYAQKPMDYVLVNTAPIASEIEQAYAESGEYPVKDDLQTREGQTILRGDFASTTKIKKNDSDVVPRSLMRHNQQKLAEALLTLIK